jgi:hypothetical protein
VIKPQDHHISAFAPPRLQLTLTTLPNKSHHRVPLKETKKQFKNSGKGHNELLEIANPLDQTRIATNAVQRHVSENRGTRAVHKPFLQRSVHLDTKKLFPRSVLANAPRPFDSSAWL